MKQLLQYVNTGESVIAEVPAPGARRGQILVRVANSLVSAGTERMVVDFAEKNMLEKARARPDLVRQTVEKARREGVLTTWDAVQNRLTQPMALGYSCAGTVMEVGAGVSEFKAGDRVACAGGGYAVHAEVVSVPRNLAVPLPAGVDFESAAFTTLAAIALQGIRLAEVELGEVAVVIGLGLLGQLTVQMLKAAGCTVLGIDLQADRAELARRSGADFATTSQDELETVCRQRSGGHGADAVLITADTKSNGPVHSAGTLARKKGVVVAVGAVGMDIPRKIYYEKELDFRISSSYGPGRYDPEYEEKGRDYPYAYVRWTEQRNMQAFVQMVAGGSVDVQPLISHRFPIDDGPAAYELITGKREEPFLGVLLTYPEREELTRKVTLGAADAPLPAEAGDAGPISSLRLGVLGAGNFANATLLPAIKDLDNVVPVGIASGRGVTARTTADRFGFRYCTTDSGELLRDPDINAVAILTRHHLHADQVSAALRAGKHVFVEKPLCLTEAELQAIVTACAETRGFSRPPQLMVGFNRRFAPFVRLIAERLRAIPEPLLLHYRTNAGFIPAEHWTQDPEQGGGRLRGEGVHFIDLVVHLAGSEPLTVTTTALSDGGRYRQDNFVVTITFENGSLATVTYASNGSKAFGKEMLEIFGGGLAARLDDYRQVTIHKGDERVQKKAWLRQDKGHRAEWAAWRDFLLGAGEHPMPFDDVVRSTRTTLAAYRSLQEERPVAVAEIEIQAGAVDDSLQVRG